MLKSIEIWFDKIFILTRTYQVVHVYFHHKKYELQSQIIEKYFDLKGTIMLDL